VCRSSFLVVEEQVMSAPDPPAPPGRGSPLHPPDRFGNPYHELDLDTLDDDPDALQALRDVRTHYIPDHSRSIVSENDSPDVGFRFSINPYRGCAHGCSYCYARPTHEYLGFNAGLDFETKILVKESAPALLRAFLARPAWQPERIAMSGVTDPYQPCERHFRIARGCLEVALEAQQPLGIITKNALIVRDLDLLRPLAAANLVHVNVSVTTLDASLARSLEPRTSTPAARLRAIKALAEAGVPVRVLTAPIIPGLNDSEIPAILEAAKEAGARAAGYTLLRLPWTVAPVFREWLARVLPERQQRIEGRIQDARGGKWNDADFANRMSGTGAFAEQIANLFRLFARKYALDGPLPPYDATRFRPPLPTTGQLRLF
jgi:DNA repair photolyase